MWSVLNKILLARRRVYPWLFNLGKFIFRNHGSLKIKIHIEEIKLIKFVILGRTEK